MKASPEPSSEVVADEFVRLDADVRRTVLDNGLTVYVRENDAPGGSAELRLVVDAGSVLEDPDQLGAAHFVEHMVFNGTEAYPENELTATLEHLGVTFGADVNAFTSYDETVYQLQLLNDEDMLETGLDVLAQWASKATITPADVDAERGVVLEELRTRDLGATGRAEHAAADLLLEGTPYAGRAPIGTAESIAAMDAPTLRRFYADWYRPDLMAVIAVGDFDAEDVEAMIEERFGGLTGPADPRPRMIPTPGNPAVAGAAVLPDPDTVHAYAQITLPLPTPRLETTSDLRAALLREVGLEVLNRRLSDDATRGAAPFLSATVGDGRIVREAVAPTIWVSADPAELSASVEAALTEVERLRRYGTSEAEVSLATAQILAAADQAYASRDDRQDVEIAEALVQHHLTGAPELGIPGERDLVHAVLDGVTSTEVDAVFQAMLDDGVPRILVVGPQSAALPDPAALTSLAAAVTGKDVDERAAEEAPPAQLMEAPAPVPVAARVELDALDATELHFANGVVVRITRTGIVDDVVVLDASKPGGTSRFAADAVLAAEAGPDIVLRSGLGAVDGVVLGRVLADRVVGLTPWIDPVRTGFTGQAGTDDLEILFQLLHLAVTAPRVDPAVLDAWRAELRPSVAQPGTEPADAVSRALAEAAYGLDPWYGPGPTLAALDALTAADVDAAWRAAFGDAAGSTFSFAGDVDLDEMEDLSRRYLGTLPSATAPRAPTFELRLPERPPGVETRRVESGVDAQATVAFEFAAPLPAADAAADIDASILQTVLGARLRDGIRERLGATYAPGVWVAVDDWPEPRVVTGIWIECDPARVDEVTAEVLAQLDDLRGGGLDDDEVDAAVTQLVNDLLFVSNEGLAATLTRYAQHLELSPRDEHERIDRAQATDRRGVTTFAAQALPADRYVLVQQTPKS
jgi:zinc protease